MSKEKTKQGSWFDRFLNALERATNKLPPPAILFIYLFCFIAILSLIMGLLGVKAVNPANQQEVVVQNFFTKDGLIWLLKNMVTNFTGFAPLGLVLTMTLAIGMCEESGLIMTLLHDKLKNVPPALLPFVVAFVGTIGNLASDTAMVVIPPLAAVLYLGAKKHPIVGIICGYAGAQAGFSANVMIAGTDGLLQGITQPAVNSFLEGTGLKFDVDITCNWYFMIASTFLCAVVIGFVCNLIVDKRFGTYVPPEGMEIEEVQESTPAQKKALRIAGIVVLVYLLIVIAATIWGPLGLVEGKEPERALVGSYFIKNLIPILFFMFAIPGVVFGRVSGKYKKFRDIAASMTKQMSGMGSYVAFCFFAGQFQKLLAWTKIDTVAAIGGADLLNALNFKGFGMIVAFILLTGIINLIMPSGSAKWAILAPIFVPMLMMAGRYHPGFTQLIYRLGDSPTNAFTPLSPYLWVQLSVAQTKYDKNIKIGTLAAGLFPIGIILQVAWIIFLAIWMLIGLDIGPGVNVHLPETFQFLAQ